ncbi:head-tail adaptor protein [Brevundimonas subvibrioides]|uniref:phage head completion protein n=1 Tax=Brevundimonas subvibrioides TaxID=74313 RepID=UPI0022B506A7|nr:head-tail adaptor protein [Brevundimonas subvibrioides]
MSGFRVLASLLDPVEAETPYGGRAISYQPLGSVWLRLEARRRRQTTEAGVTAATEVATAVMRTDPRLAEGRVIRFGGADWTIAAVDADPDRPGRTRVSLERSR